MPQLIVAADNHSLPNLDKCIWESGRLAVTTECHRPGIDVEAVGILLDGIKADYRLERIYSWGSQVENSSEWSGVYGLLQNGSIDLIATLFTQSSQRIQSFDFAYPIQSERRYFVVGKPENDILASMMLILRVFNIETWLLILVIMLISALSTFLVLNIFRCYVDNGCVRQYGAAFWTTLRISFKQADDSIELYQQLCASACINTVVFGLFAIFVQEMYKALLVGHLLYTPTKKPFDSSDQILAELKSGTLHLILPHQGYRSTLQLDDPRTPIKFLKQLQEALQYNPVVYESDTDRIRAMIHTGRYVFFTSASRVMMLRGKNDCDMVLVETSELPLLYSSLMLRRNSTLLRQLNQAIKNTQIYTRMDLIHAKYDHCKRINDKTSSTTSSYANLTLLAMSGTFYLLLIAYMLGAFLLIAERLLKCNIEI